MQTRTLLGEKKRVEQFERVTRENNSYIINLYGETGAGKSTLIQMLVSEYQKEDIIYISDYAQILEIDFDEDKDMIIIIEDIDEKINPENLAELISKTLIHYETFKMIVSSKSRYFYNKIAGLQIFSIELGSRNFSINEFKAYLEATYPELSINEGILENLYLLATYIHNFNYVETIIKRLMEQEKDISQIDFMNLIEQSNLYSRLREEVVIEHNTDISNNYIFNIRRKDPIEKLRDILIKYYEEETLLVSVLKSVYENSTFIDGLFGMDISYEDKVMQLCFTYNPVELITKLLGVRDIINELNHRKIKAMSLTIAMEDKAKLLLKNMGLNIIDSPKGIKFHQTTIRQNEHLVKTSNEMRVSREHLIGLGISCYQELEKVYHELLNFYGLYFCGSIGYLVELYNKESGNRFLKTDRLTYGNYIELFRFINRLSKRDGYQIASFELNRKEVVPKSVIKRIEALSSKRKHFSHKSAMAASYLFLRDHLLEIYNLSSGILETLGNERIFPEIIKIKEIIFDEYGRKLFVGYDDGDTEIRFSISKELQIVDIYMHYYVLRKNSSFAVNPIIIPKTVDDNEQLFDNGEVYDQSSDTQFAQAGKLMDMTELDGVNHLLDIGCGNGKTTLAMYSRKQDMQVDAFDISDSMINTAKKNLEKSDYPATAINFFVMGGMELNKENAYDLIFSNAALHWLTDSQAMYGKIFRALRQNGRIAIHQGGHESYRGLHDMVTSAIDALHFGIYYKGWDYPIFYPKKSEMEKLLRTVGFTNIEVVSYETDGKEYSNLVENFANAGMLPYLSVLDDDKKKKALRDKYFELCNSTEVDLYSHRLYIFANKEQS